LLALSAFLLTLALSDAPRLHEQIHNTQGAEHVCSVTMLVANGVDLCGNALAVRAPYDAPEHHLFASEAATGSLVPLDFLLLEHAPPVLS
jgi:hypothetical protein